MTTSWKQLILEAESLTENNGKNAWRTALIVRELANCPTFMDECDNDADERDSRLAKFSGRFAISLAEMIHMIEHFPELKHWESGRLDCLRYDTARIIGKQRDCQKQASAVAKRTELPTHLPPKMERRDTNASPAETPATELQHGREDTDLVEYEQARIAGALKRSQDRCQQLELENETLRQSQASLVAEVNRLKKLIDRMRDGHPVAA